jgi:hypothetical protein|nr:MAG TPA: Diphteria toxin repressor SH3 domain [Caudoviricetes sp.]
MKKKTVQLSGKKYIKVASATGCKFSKIMVAICLVISCTSCANSRHKHKDSLTPTPVQITAKVEKDNSMYFSSEYVTETLYQGATGYHYIVYDDIDAGMDHELLQVDKETFRRIEAAMSTKNGKMKGFLIETEGQFTYCHDKE